MNRTNAGLRYALSFSLVFFAMFPVCGQAQVSPVSKPAVITHHEGTFNGHAIQYTAAVEPIDVSDAKGNPAARLVAISYVADTRPSMTRPVMFAFNGGPIVASLFLHIGSLGPKRIAIPDDLSADPNRFSLVDNPYSPLDVMDLVFVDPASTGFSRVLPGTAPEAYRSVVADGQQISALIVEWLAKHGRQSSPVYVLGESYGTVRAAEVAGQLAERPTPVLLAGVVLMGQAINIVEYSQRRQNTTSYVVSLPTLAALAWYHQKIDRKNRTLEQVVDEAWQFAQSDYLPALFKGDSIDTAARDRVAKRLEELSGIPAEYYRIHNLRITKEQYRGELLKDRGLLLGRSDGRYTSPMTEKGLAADPSAAVMPAFTRLFETYLRDDLKVDWPDKYEPMSEVSLEEWKWGGTSPFSDWPYSDRILKMMKVNPQFCVLIGNGYYDTSTTVGAAKLAVAQAGWPTGSASLAFYEGGHMPYTIERSARKFCDDLRAFVSPKQ